VPRRRSSRRHSASRGQAASSASCANLDGPLVGGGEQACGHQPLDQRLAAGDLAQRLAPDDRARPLGGHQVAKQLAHPSPLCAGSSASTASACCASAPPTPPMAW
jgi:hypothetical protein